MRPAPWRTRPQREPATRAASARGERRRFDPVRASRPPCLFAPFRHPSGPLRATILPGTPRAAKISRNRGELYVTLTRGTVRAMVMSETLTSSPSPAADANLGYLFRLAYQRFRAALERELRDFGLSAQEYGVLSVFETRAELSTSELARLAQVTRQTMHAAVLRLEAAGL